MNNSISNGIKWGPFTLRIPFIHIKFRSGEFLQGLVISGATAFAAAPWYAARLTFEEAVALSLIAGTLISAGPIIFGEPMAPGWVTPAVPLVMGALAQQECMAYNLVLMEYVNTTLIASDFLPRCVLNLRFLS